ncbi:MAG: ATP-binding protein [Flavitalea sp.]
MILTANTQTNSSAVILAEALVQWGKAHIQNAHQFQQITSVSPIIAEVFTLLQSEAAEKDIMLTNNTFQKVNVPVSKSIINFMILNLVNNSIKYSSEGRIEVACETERNWLYISVKDAGVGMTVEQIEKVMQPNATSGTGLTIINEFLQQLQGGMVIDSIPRKGTTVTLSIPLNN